MTKCMGKVRRDGMRSCAEMEGTTLNSINKFSKQMDSVTSRESHQATKRRNPKGNNAEEAKKRPSGRGKGTGHGEHGRNMVANTKIT
jgi:hypothetical protein